MWVKRLRPKKRGAPGAHPGRSLPRQPKTRIDTGVPLRPVFWAHPGRSLKISIPKGLRPAQAVSIRRPGGAPTEAGGGNHRRRVREPAGRADDCAPKAPTPLCRDVWLLGRGSGDPAGAPRRRPRRSPDLGNRRMPRLRIDSPGPAILEKAGQGRSARVRPHRLTRPAPPAPPTFTAPAPPGFA